MIHDDLNNSIAEKNEELAEVGKEQDHDGFVLDDEIEASDVEHFDDAIKLYLRDVLKTKPLSAEEEKELAGKIAEGNKAARDKMVVSNLRLVVKVAMRYLNRGLPFLDLIEEGNIGLIKAVDKFKISKECRFSTYAIWWIRQSMQRAIVNQVPTIRLPVNVAEYVNKMFWLTKELKLKNNVDASDKEISIGMGVDIAYHRSLMVLVKKTYSIDMQMSEDHDHSLLDTIEDTSNVSVAEHLENSSKYEVARKCLSMLAANEISILTLRFGLDDNEPQTLEAISHIYGLTRERIRQIEANALAKLRNIVDETTINPFSNVVA